MYFLYCRTHTRTQTYVLLVLPHAHTHPDLCTSCTAARTHAPRLMYFLYCRTHTHTQTYVLLVLPHAHTHPDLCTSCVLLWQRYCIGLKHLHPPCSVPSRSGRLVYCSQVYDVFILCNRHEPTYCTRTVYICINMCTHAHATRARPHTVKT